jgi:hypothetical protein
MYAKVGKTWYNYEEKSGWMKRRSIYGRFFQPSTGVIMMLYSLKTTYRPKCCNITGYPKAKETLLNM